MDTNRISTFHVEHVRNPADKPRFIRVTDPTAIEAIQRNLLDDPIGGQDKAGNWWAYAWSVERWQAAARAAGLRSGGLGHE